jgi:hypothetical protein
LPPSMRAFASPPRRVELADRGSHIFSPPQCEVVHTCAKFFEARAEEGKRNGTERASAMSQILAKHMNRFVRSPDRHCSLGLAGLPSSARRWR